jgi:hypothetical protein
MRCCGTIPLGSSLLGILDSHSIFATQVSCLNDSTEIRYASKLYQAALDDLRSTVANDSIAYRFIEGALLQLREDVEFPAHAGMPYFVTCFSDIEDDLSQWRAYGGGENGYALGFRAKQLFGIPNSVVVRVAYDRDLHLDLARTAAKATIDFFLEGLEKQEHKDPAAWAEEFFPVWDSIITQVAPLVKDAGFSGEREYRIVKSFALEELPNLRFIQKNSLMSRHLPLQPPSGNFDGGYKLPLSRIVVGPCRFRQVSRISVDTLLRQKGYSTGLVATSKSPFQVT